MSRRCPDLSPRRAATLALVALIGCAHTSLEHQPVPAFVEGNRGATPVPPGRRVMAGGGSQVLSATQTPQGAVLAMAWQGPGGEVDQRWRYLLFSAASEGVWTWESPAGEAHGDLHLGAGASVDLLVEDRVSGQGPARWVAIDRAQRRVLIGGQLDGARCGEVIPLGGDRFVFGSGAHVALWETGMERPVVLGTEAGDVCLIGALQRDGSAGLLWTTGETSPTLRYAPLNAGAAPALGAAEDLRWPSGAAPLRPGRKIRVLDEPDGGFALVYQGAPGDAGSGSAGLWQVRYNASRQPTDQPRPLTDPVGCATEAHPDRWDLVKTEHGPVVLRCTGPGGPTPTSPDLSLRLLPTAPDLRELALNFKSDASLICGPQGCDLWTEAPSGDTAQLVRARLGPVPPVDVAREATARDGVAQAVYGLLHTDNEPGGVLELAQRTCLSADALDRRLDQGTGGATASGDATSRVWDLPEGVISARFSPSTGCMDGLEVKRKPPVRR